MTENPEFISGSNLLGMLLSSLPGMSGDAGMVLQMMQPVLNNVFKNSPWYNTIYSTNCGGMGLFEEYRSREARALGTNIMNDWSRRQLREHIYNLEAQAMSADTWRENIGKEAWRKEHGVESVGGSPESREAWLNRRADSWMSKGSVPFVYWMASQAFPGLLDDSMRTGTALSNAATNLAMQGFRRNDVNAIENSRKIVESLFAKGQDTDKWGMSRGAIADIASKLTQDMDFMSGLSSGDVGTAIKRFQSTVRAYTEALEPLKSVMGEDTPRMIKAMEGITGQRFSSMSADTVNALANKLASRTSSGAYTMKEFGESLTMATAAMAKMPGLSPWNYTATPAQGMRVADIVYGEAHPDYLTDSQWKAAATHIVSQTHNSGGADLFAKTYAAWAERRRAGGLRTDASEFQSAVNDYARRTGLDPRMAARQMTGTTQDYALDSYKGSAFYRMAIQDGSAGEMTMDAYLNQTTRLGAAHAANNMGFRAALGRATTGRDGTFINARAASTMYSAVISAAKNNPMMLKMEGEQLQQELNRLGINMSADQFTAATNYIKSDSYLNRALTQAQAAYNSNKASREERDFKRRNAELKEMDLRVFNRNTGLMDLFSGGDIQGNISKIIADSRTIKGLSLYGDADAQSLLRASVQASYAEYGNAKGKSDARADFAKKMWHYALSDEGRKNKGFTDAFKRYSEGERQAREQFNKDIWSGVPLSAAQEKYKEAMKGLEGQVGLMREYMELGGDKVDEFLKAGGTVTELQQIRKQASKMNKPSVYIDSQIKQKGWEKRLNALKGEDKENMQDQFNSFVNWQRQKYGQDLDNVDFAKGFRQYMNEYIEVDGRKVQRKDTAEGAQFNELMNGVTGGDQGNVMERVAEAVEQLVAWLQGKFNNPLPDGANK